MATRRHPAAAAAHRKFSTVSNRPASHSKQSQNSLRTFGQSSINSLAWHEHGLWRLMTNARLLLKLNRLVSLSLLIELSEDLVKQLRG